MNNPHLDQAREWARDNIDDFYEDESAYAVCEVILSLPNTVVDGDKLRELAEKADEGFYSAGSFLRRVKELLPTPPLPTLADMTPEERGTQKWMQAKVFPTASTLGIITGVDEYSHSAIILFADGMAKKVPWEDITPLPDLPKLEWPGSAPDDVAYATGGALTTQDVVDECRAVRKERALPRPEDVPAGEPWLVEYDGIRHVGAREKGAVTYLDWALARLDGTECVAARDREITLISRLVPEVGA